MAPTRSRGAAAKPKQDNLQLLILGVIAFAVVVGLFTLQFGGESNLQEQEANEEFFRRCQAVGLSRAEVVHVAKGLTANFSEQKSNYILGQLPRMVTECGGQREFRRIMRASDSEFFQMTVGLDSDDKRMLSEIQQVFPPPKR